MNKKFTPAYFALALTVAACETPIMDETIYDAGIDDDAVVGYETDPRFTDGKIRYGQYDPNANGGRNGYGNNGYGNGRGNGNNGYGSNGYGNGQYDGTELNTAVGDTIYFGYDSSTLNEQARQIVASQANWLKANPAATVKVEGHTDERGTREYNLALGERRANAVKRFLVQSGISSNRVETISYGKEKPAVSGVGAEVYGRNRRARTTIR